ncbi:molybdenum cofactor guanylyltransferase [Oceanobacillus halophilus]|uniref:Probable molybdenum cofactor guanylyltransferase n=1 Tax=Oceanobacillus halophilus TaxID=930130 RepID=A0A495ABL8_9BACI|nr:molybdenum cofactor guanylyltransferase [Oceanobacillus halophilus]RKQ37243.1 molybdenum cofactor guanylyltransferase [Oceanobacillus halophilus]
MVNDIMGIVLAGGYSRRFGTPKAFVKRNGKYFYQISIDALTRLTNKIVVITNPDLEKLFQMENGNFAIINDRKQYEGKGPLAGIFTAMDAVDSEWYAVTPVDVPFIDDQVFQKLLKHLDGEAHAIIPVVSGKIQPLIAIYHYSVKEEIRDQLEGDNLSVKDMLNKCKVKYISIQEEQPFYNINQVSDYEKWIGK